MEYWAVIVNRRSWDRMLPEAVILLPFAFHSYCLHYYLCFSGFRNFCPSFWFILLFYTAAILFLFFLFCVFYCYCICVVVVSLCWCSKRHLCCLACTLIDIHWIYYYYYYYYSTIWISLVTGLFFLVLLLNHRWSPPLTLQASHCSTFRIMCDVPSIVVFCSEPIECFPGTVSKFFLKLLVTIPVAPIITGTIVHFRFHIRFISLHKLLYFNLFSASFCTTFPSAGIIIIIIIRLFRQRTSVQILA